MSKPAAKGPAVERVEQGGSIHSFSETERKAYVEYINGCLSDDKSLKGIIPINPDNNDYLTVIKDGVVLGKLLAHWFPKDLDSSKIYVKPKNTFEAAINQDIVINTSKALGCSVVNIGAQDLIDAKEHLVFGLTWQVIKLCLLSQIQKMELSLLAEGDEVIASVPPEQLILRWFNYHLKNAGHHRIVTNFSTDLMDSENYVVLLSQLSPDKIPPKDVEAAFREKDTTKRAEMVLEFADRLDCRKFLTAKEIVKGNPRLNLAFCANLFKNYPGLGPTKEDLANKRANELQLKLDQTIQELNEANRQNRELKDELLASKKAFEDLTEQMKQLALQLAQAIAERDQLAKEKKEAAEKMAKMQNEIDSLRNENSSLKDELASVKNELSKTKDELKAEKELREKFEKLANDLKNELEQKIKQFEEEKNKLLKQIEDVVNENNRLKDALEKETKAKEEALRKLNELDETYKKALADWEEERARLLKRIKELEEEVRRLNDLLEKERAAKDEYSIQLSSVEQSYQEYRSEAESDKASLLTRIRRLEEELRLLQEKMKMSLDAAEKDKLDALMRAEEQRMRELLEAEARANRDMDKIKLLLTGNQRQGWLQVQSKGLLGGWKQRFFVLKDGTLFWFPDETSVTKTRPLGVISCEEVRLFELDEKQVKKPNCFAISIEKSGTKDEMNVAAHKAEEMRDWMQDIRLAKKKKLGVEVVSKPRESMIVMGGRQPSSPTIQPTGTDSSPRTDKK